MAIDAATGETVARVTGLGVPYRLAVSDPGRERLVLIDRAAGAVSAEVDFAAASTAEGLGAEPSPQGFTLTPDGAWTLVSAKGIDRVGLVHIPTASLVRFVPTGAGPDGIAFSPVTAPG